MNGILVVDKPQDFTSFDVVAKLRGICGTRKMGHGGTLDPMATGVLPVFVGPAVKAVDMQARQDKCYEAEILFGTGTDTGDITGNVVCRGREDIDETELRKVLEGFVGEGEQIPPMVSAVKIDGKPLYRYAREGKTIERKPRPITIHSAECTGRVAEGRFAVRVHCSKGTYIRVLAEDLGRALGTCATLSALRRTGAGVFLAKDAHTLQTIQAAKDAGQLESLFTPLERVFEERPLLEVDEAGFARLLNGAAVYGMRQQEGVYRLCHGGDFIGLGAVEGQELRAKKLFLAR